MANNEKQNKAFYSADAIFVTHVCIVILSVSSENGRAKRRKTGEVRPNEPESEQEEHSLSLSQHSSPSQSDQEQNGAHKLSASPNTSISGLQPFVRLKANGALRSPGPGGISSRPLKTDQFLRSIAPQHRQEVQFLSSDHKPQPRPPGPPLVCHSHTLIHSSEQCSLSIMLLNGYCFASADWRRGSWDDRWSFRFWVPHDRRREWAALQRRSICSCKQSIRKQNIDDIRAPYLVFC